MNTYMTYGNISRWMPPVQSNITRIFTYSQYLVSLMPAVFTKCTCNKPQACVRIIQVKNIAYLDSDLSNDVDGGPIQLLQQWESCLAISHGSKVTHEQVRAGIELIDTGLQIAVYIHTTQNQWSTYTLLLAPYNMVKLIYTTLIYYTK